MIIYINLHSMSIERLVQICLKGYDLKGVEIKVIGTHNLVCERPYVWTLGSHGARVLPTYLYIVKIRE